VRRCIDIMLDSEATREALCSGPMAAALVPSLVRAVEKAASDLQDAVNPTNRSSRPCPEAPAAAVAIRVCFRATLHARSRAEEQGVQVPAGVLLPAGVKTDMRLLHGLPCTAHTGGWCRTLDALLAVAQSLRTDSTDLPSNEQFAVLVLR